MNRHLKKRVHLFFSGVGKWKYILQYWSPLPFILSLCSSALNKTPWNPLCLPCSECDLNIFHSFIHPTVFPCSWITSLSLSLSVRLYLTLIPLKLSRNELPFYSFSLLFQFRFTLHRPDETIPSESKISLDIFHFRSLNINAFLVSSVQRIRIHFNRCILPCDN
jgi:hypothetical protein